MRKRAFAGAILVLSLCQPVWAVIVNGGSGDAYNTSTPAAGFGYWSHVGQWRNSGGSLKATSLYLGDGWALTANHAWVLDGGSAATVQFDGASYDIVDGSQVRITNGNGTGADLIKFRIDGDPGLAAIGQDDIISGAPAIGSQVYMMGYGRDREETLTYWDAGWNEVDPPPPPRDHTGYKWTSDRYKRWGVNDVELTGQLVQSTYGDTTSFRTIFDLAGGDNEAQATSGDSGGAVFVLDGTTWKLAGVMFTTAGFTGQPGDTSVYGNGTWIADMSVYGSQVPEPATLALFAIGGAGLCAVRRRRRAAQ